MKDLLLSPLILMFLLVSCNNIESREAYLDCSELCDSIYPMIRNDDTMGYTQFHHGIPMGKFIYFDGDNTIFAYKEYIDTYLKSTFNYKEYGLIVKLLSDHDGQMKIREYFQYDSDTSLVETSKYVKILNQGEYYNLSPKGFKFDSINLEFNNHIITGTVSDEISVSINAVETMGDSDLMFLNLYEVDSLEDGGYKLVKWNVPLSRSRIVNPDIIKPNKIVLW